MTQNRVLLTKKKKVCRVMLIKQNICFIGWRNNAEL